MKKKKRSHRLIKIRRRWAISPVTRVVKNEKKYDRKRQKTAWKRSLKEEL